MCTEQPRTGDDGSRARIRSRSRGRRTRGGPRRSSRPRIGSPSRRSCRGAGRRHRTRARRRGVNDPASRRDLAQLVQRERAQPVEDRPAVLDPGEHELPIAEAAGRSSRRSGRRHRSARGGRTAGSSRAAARIDAGVHATHGDHAALREHRDVGAPLHPPLVSSRDRCRAAPPRAAGRRDRERRAKGSRRRRARRDPRDAVPELLRRLSPRRDTGRRNTSSSSGGPW